MPLLTRTGWTVERLAELPDDGNRYEIIDGELFVTPAPSLLHQRALGSLFLQLDGYASALDLLVAFAPVDVAFSDRSSVQPDIVVLPFVDGKPPRAYADVGRLVLALEVLSPSTARRDRTVKRALYQQNTVTDYWVVDLDARTIEVWHPSDARPLVCACSVTWHPSPQHPPLHIDVAAFFAALD